MERILITGAGGLLGGYLVAAARRQDLAVVTWNGRADVNLGDIGAPAVALVACKPRLVVHAAAVARIDECRRQPGLAHRVNAEVPAQMAEVCRRLGAHFVHVSTEMVFSGEEAPYAVDAPTRPTSHYGAMKAEGEPAVLGYGGAVARMALLLGPSLDGKPSYFGSQMQAFREGRPVNLFEDEWRTPLDLASAAEALVALAIARADGIWHLGGPERLTRMDMGLTLARALKADESLCVPTKRPDDRPRDLSLDSSRWRSAFPHTPWPTFAEAVGRMT